MEENTMKKTKLTTKTIVMIGLFAAITAVLAQVAIPTPWGVPITLQPFAVALCAYVLGYKYGTASIAIYVLLGIIGLPVFAEFSSGLGVILGVTGGFIWGFIVMAFVCGFYEKAHSKRYAMVFGILGLVLCHLLGTIQFSLLMSMSFMKSLLLVSVPYILKDIASVLFAYAISLPIKKVVGPICERKDA